MQYDTQAEANKEAQIAGITHAKGNVLKYLGRKPSFTREQLQAVRNMLEHEAGTSTIEPLRRPQV